VGAVLVIGLLAAVAAGCKEQQLSEENVALRRQLEKALADGAEMQARLEGLETQNQAMRTDLETPKPAAVTPGTAATAAAKAGRTKPEFGEGTETKLGAGGELTVTLHDEVLFAPGSADLKPGSKKILDKVASVLNGEYKGDRIRIGGHTDNQPIRKTKNKWQDNWDLSCNRAMAVLRYLSTKGVAPERMYAAGYSFHKPVAPNTTPQGRQKNRRVEIVVSPR
jgi:chemotaxis protein MotB